MTLFSSQSCSSKGGPARSDLDPDHKSPAVTAFKSAAPKLKGVSCTFRSPLLLCFLLTCVCRLFCSSLREPGAGDAWVLSSCRRLSLSLSLSAGLLTVCFGVWIWGVAEKTFSFFLRPPRDESELLNFKFALGEILIPHLYWIIRVPPLFGWCWVDVMHYSVPEGCHYFSLCFEYFKCIFPNFPSSFSLRTIFFSPAQ